MAHNIGGIGAHIHTASQAGRWAPGHLIRIFKTSPIYHLTPMANAFVEFGGRQIQAGLDAKVHKFLPPEIAGIHEHFRLKQNVQIIIKFK